MAYGEVAYLETVRAGVNNNKAFDEIQASNERHQKMQNLLLCELIKQFKTLNENLYLFAAATEMDGGTATDISKLLSGFLPTEIKQEKDTPTAPTPAVEELDIKQVDKLPVPEPEPAPAVVQAQKPVKQQTVIEKYGIKEPVPGEKPSVPLPPPPVVDKSIPATTRKAAFGKLPRHQPSAASTNVTDSLS